MDWNTHQENTSEMVLWHRVTHRAASRRGFSLHCDHRQCSSSGILYTRVWHHLQKEDVTKICSSTAHRTRRAERCILGEALTDIRAGTTTQ
ncbi:hypothetical protein E2C01_073054 [Portunus trituberculatus]|uniref:Uncharacterized protein n=1 Tax=Portunus trituberculatus TaxID=210409 RepID=A0A5B7I8V8_PORTR|nr:hypothetical protein [Portunus trituberculatus]